MEPSYFDHAFVLLLTLFVPIYGRWDFQRTVRRVAAGDAGARVRFYVGTIVVEWIVTLGLLGAWFLAARPATGLGLGLVGGWRLWAGLALLAVIGALLAQQVASARRPGAVRDSMRRQLQPAFALLPHDRRDLRAFLGVSVTAGICEEIVYRGFLIAYFATFTNLALAVLLSSLVFALGHSYQGFAGASKVFMIGLVMAGLYVLTRSLFVPMVAHTALDVASGLMAYSLATGPDEEPPT